MTANQASATPAPERRVDSSMEEILASIRKIIADEDGGARRASASPPPTLRPSLAVEERRPETVVTPISPQVTPFPPQLAIPRPSGPALGLSRPLAPGPAAPALASPTLASPGTATPGPAAPAAPAQGGAAAGVAAVSGLRPVTPIEIAYAEGPAVLPLVVERPVAERAVAEPPSVAVTSATSPVAQWPAARSSDAALHQPTSLIAAQPEPVLPEPVLHKPALPPVDAGALVSTATTQSISSAFEVLAASVALTSSETIDRHVRDLLRPMLRTWLDDNLPTIVEKLVRVEIERVARGGR